MSIIFQVSAWVILAVGFFALGHKFFPNFKNWFTTGKVSYVWLIAITLGLFVLLTYPYFFNWWAINFWNVPEGELTDLTKLGPLGDIYGSLNTIFTSATLAFVVYATFLQRQANIDARIAMDKQLQQSQKATAAQLREARRSTKEQLIQAKYALRAQLKQAEESTKKQIALARATHDAQIIESQNAIFITKFYGLLNYKKDNLDTIFIKKKCVNSKGKSEERGISGVNAIETLANKFYDILSDHPHMYPNFNKKELENDLIKISKEFGYDSISRIISYFHIYIDLCRLISTSKLSEDDKNFYKSILSNSMTQHEQIFLFWIAPIYDIFELTNTEIFSMFAPVVRLIPYALKHHDRSHFKHNEWKDIF